jgi:hypothetical protein
MKGQTSYDKERLFHINDLMEKIHSESNTIYECLVDREFDKLQETVSNLQIILKDISLSVEDDI